MPAFKIRRDEFEIVKQAALRVERRSNSRFVMDQTKVEVTDGEGLQSSDDVNGEQEPKPPAVFD
jgi:hypothetical protein